MKSHTSKTQSFFCQAISQKLSLEHISSVFDRLSDRLSEFCFVRQFIFQSNTVTSQHGNSPELEGQNSVSFWTKFASYVHFSSVRRPGGKHKGTINFKRSEDGGGWLEQLVCEMLIHVVMTIDFRYVYLLCR